MNIIKIHITDIKDEESFAGDAIITDSKGQECHVEWSVTLWDEAVDIIEFTLNGYEASYNDRWVESEDEYGYVCTEYDPAKKQYVPVPTETAILSDEDYDALSEAISDYFNPLLNRAKKAAHDAFRGVFESAKEVDA